MYCLIIRRFSRAPSYPLGAIPLPCRPVGTKDRTLYAEQTGVRRIATIDSRSQEGY